MIRRVKILGSYVDALTMEETLGEVDKIINYRRPVQHVVVNASKINLMKQDDQLTEIVNSCPIINADGQSVVWAAKILNKPLPERVTGIDLFENLVKISSLKEYKLFFFGASEDVVKRVVNIYKEKYPEINIVGYRSGYFTEAEEKKIVNDIKKVEPDILFVAFSSPKKEYWINKYLYDLNVPFVMGVGGSFDVIAGLTTRAPKWMQQAGLEWFHRFIQEPKRMFKRYIVGNLKFCYLVLLEKINIK
ncbi:WecB/TagA/CpsF family glycosyltransferase [Gottfriedia sp. NPDC057991]|uniref:WecB/TagA/CpsF family glycosyltransferase n=1 Tax=Gottfriedia sp. NPDC057991 TaxID=3346298 RepID=UPI0036DCB32C